MDMLGDTVLDDEIEVPISAIEHFSYCPRQCALIHVEQTYDENLFTIRGRLAHERVHSSDDAPSSGVRAVRGMALWSERLGVRGKSDLVEFPAEGPYPVEYKVGRRLGLHADLQLCAQALCLEEMLGEPVQQGAIYYHALRRRHEVAFDSELRRQTVEAIESIRKILREQTLPRAPNDERCPQCSLLNACLPFVVGEPARMRGLQGDLFRVYAPGSGGLDKDHEDKEEESDA